MPYSGFQTTRGALKSYEYTGVKQCTFQWMISNDIAHKEMFFNGFQRFSSMVFSGLVIHHLIMITFISYEIILTISLPELVYIAPL